MAVWSDKATKLLIHLRQEHEADFNKPSTKKKNLWEKISAKLREYGHDFTGPQSENKWKNLTKEYRKTVDTNNTSGSSRATCSYYDELNAAYGYRPNVTPVVTCSSLKPLQPPPSNPNTPISKRKRDEIDDENASIVITPLSSKIPKKAKRRPKTNMALLIESNERIAQKQAEIEEAKLALAKEAIKIQQERNEMLRMLISQTGKANQPS